MKIAIDAGHGGTDPGAVGPTQLKESVVVLEISKKLAEMLKKHQVNIVLTRDEEVFIELGERCEVANSAQADYFVSIHCNSNGPDAVGIETLYKSDKGKRLAGPVQEHLIAATGDRDRGLKQRNDLYVLNGTNMPAIMAEIGFISHPDTESKLRTDDYKHKIVKAIFDGLAATLGFAPVRVRV
jgi:N-acetylmuramoyl-L-alanine amidase